MNKNKSRVNGTGHKILMIGNANVGKTTILHRFIFNEFLEKTETTLCGGVKIKNIAFTDDDNN